MPIFNSVKSKGNFAFNIGELQLDIVVLVYQHTSNKSPSPQKSIFDDMKQELTIQ